MPLEFPVNFKERHFYVVPTGLERMRASQLAQGIKKSSKPTAPVTTIATIQLLAGIAIACR